MLEAGVNRQLPCWEAK